MRLVALGILLVLIAAAAAGARVVTGTARNDRLVGTPSADVIRGLAGNDELLGRGGADYLQGGPGRDTIDAGAGGDLVAVSYDGARDTTRCGSGLDVVNADLTDAVARDCELVGRRLSRDPYRSTDAQHETEVEPDSFTFGRTTVAAFQVGRRVDGAATNVGYAVTTDDGATWRQRPPARPDRRERSGWTESTRERSGRRLRRGAPDVAHLDARAGRRDQPPHDQPLVRRIDLGNRARSRSRSRSARGVAFDKNWVGCDNTATSPHFGRCYLVFTHSSDRDMLAVSWSDDGGLTWSAAADIGARPAVGVFPAIRPTGELVVVYLWEVGQAAIAASRSSDGGATWDAPVRIADVEELVCASRASARSRSRPPTSTATGASGRRGTTACREARPTPSMSRPRPTGATWTAAAAVTRNRNAVLPAIGIDAGTGRVAIAYMRSGANGVDVELVVSQGAATGFGAPRRLSAEASALPSMARTTSGRMLGDYISVHFSSGRPLVVWVLALTPVNGAFREAVYATRG